MSTVFFPNREMSNRWSESLIVSIKIFLWQKNGLNFWKNYTIKLQFVNLLVDYIKSDRICDKAVIANRGFECFYRAWQWLLTFRNWIICRGRLIKKFPCMLSILFRKATIQFALLSMIQIFKPNQYIPLFLFSPQILTRQSQGQRWSKLSWYTCDCFSSWEINLSNSACSHMLTGFNFTNPFFSHSKIKTF